MMNKSKTDPSGLIYLIPGAVFLFNPTYHIIDPLPDAIGFLLFFIGLVKLSVLNDEIGEAKRLYIRLFAAECVRICLYFTLPYVSSMFVLIYSSVLAIVEAIMFIPAADHMFRGFEFLDMRMDCSAARGIKKKNKVIPSASLRNLTVTAFIIRALGSVLPLLPTLTVDSNTVVDSMETSNADFMSLLIFAAAILLGAVFGILWLIRFVKYIKGITNDKDCCQRIFDEYSKWTAANTIKIVCANMNAVMLLLIGAAALCFNMYVDGVNIFPNALGAALVFAAFILLRGTSKALSVSGNVLCVLWAACSVVNEYMQINYKANNYRPASAAHMIGKAPQLYFRMELCGYIEAVLAAAVMILMLVAFRKTLKSHAKRFAFYDTEQKKKFDKWLVPVIIMWIIVIAMIAAVFPIMKFFTEIWLINFVLVIVLTAFMIHAYNVLYDGVYMKLHD